MDEVGKARESFAPAAKTFRVDIEGLRALAVLLVVSDHLLGFPAGGYLGVDIFFVISGYLITGLLVREYRRGGGISFSAFYARRIRRIIPAAFVVLALTVPVSYIVWYRPRADQTLLDAFSAVTFVSNWHFAFLGTDYLQANVPVSPLQHYWSLSVEEQFYLVWPVLILAVCIACAKLGLNWERSRQTLSVALMVVVVASFGWATYRVASNPASAYFDSVGRAWELAIGGFAAVVGAHVVNRVPDAVRTVVGLGALVGMVGTAFVLTPESSMPAPDALVPVALTAVFLGISIPARSPVNVVLGNPVIRYVGRISFSLYLWHFPVFVLLKSTPLAGTPAYFVVAIVGTVSLSMATYHLVERPVLKSKWLSSWMSPAESGATGHRRWQIRQLGIGLMVFVLILSATALQYRGPGAILTSSAYRAAFGGVGGETAVSAAPAAFTQDAIPGEILAAIERDEWPSTLVPALDQLDTNMQPDAMHKGTGCRYDVGAEITRWCEYGKKSASKVAVIVGDSIALSWTPAVVGALVPAGWRVMSAGYASCPLIASLEEDAGGKSGASKRCAESRETLLDAVGEIKPDIVVTSGSLGSFNRQIGVHTVADRGDAWKQATSTTLARLGEVAGAVAVISNPPLGIHPQECTGRLLGPQACLTTITEEQIVKNESERAAVESLDSVRASFVDATDWFCSDSGNCPAFIGTTMLRTDTGHLTDRASSQYASLIADSLAQIVSMDNEELTEDKDG